MKVLFVCTGNYCRYYPGDISPPVRRIGDALKECGVEVDYFLIKGKGISGYLKNIKRLKHFLTNRDYKIIHAHYGISGIVSQLAREHQKLVVSFMGSDLLGSVNSQMKYSFQGNLLAKINRYFAGLYDFKIVKSQSMLPHLKHTDNTIVIPNGVDFKSFFPMEKSMAREKLGFDQNTRTCLFVADPENYVKNFPLAKAGVDLFNKDKKICELIVVFGKTDLELNLYYNAADIVLLTSFHEGSPNVIKEAMACNCPIITTDVGDVKELIADTDGCRLTTFEPEDVAEKLEMALSYGKRTNGREHVRHLDSSVVVRRILEVYHHVLTDKK